MGFFGTSFILCGILYIIACVMDGQDVKPLWKKWVGKKLEKSANYFFPIKYVTETKYIPVEPPVSPFERYDIEKTTFDAQKIQCVYRITETDIMEEFMRYGRIGVNLEEYLIQRRMKDCMSSLYNEIRLNNVVNFDIDRSTDAPNIIIRAWLYVGKKRS